MMSNFWSGLGFGAAVGGILALLYAPQTGEELQANLKTFVEESGLEIKEIKEAFENVQNHLAEYQQVQTDLVQPTINELKQLLQEFDFQSQARLSGIEKQGEKIEQHLNKQIDSHLPENDN